MPTKQSDLGELSQDEIDLVVQFRNAKPTDRAQIFLAAHAPETELDEDKMLKLQTFAAYLECNEYGRKRCREAMEIFAMSPSTEEAIAKFEELDRTREKATVHSISDFR